MHASAQLHSNEKLFEMANMLQVDMYRFGVLLWEIITHQQPARGQLRDLQIPQDCPQAISDLHEACLASDPAYRPSAAQAVKVIQLSMSRCDWVDQK